MKILYIIADANLRGGTEILAFNLLHELNASNVECRLLSVEPYRGDDYLVISLTAEEHGKWARLQANPLNKLKGSFHSDTYLRQLIAIKAEELGVEWIINHTYDMCAVIPTDGRWKTAQVFNWSIRGYEASLLNIIKKKSAFSRIPSMVSLKALKSRWHKALPSFTRLVMLTDAAHAEIKEVCPSVKNEQFVTIPDPLMQKEDSKVLTSLSNKNVVFVGRLSHEKGVMRLLRIWKQIVKQLPDYTLSIYGTGDCLGEMVDFLKVNGLRFKVYGEHADCDSLEKSINPQPSSLNLQPSSLNHNPSSTTTSQVQFMGFCNDLAEIYTHADLLLMTSDSEGFGMVLIEAMYYGVPCITFDCPVSPKEIIADAGIAVPCFDEEMYADEVINLLQDPKRKEDLQKKAIKRARNYYINNINKHWNSVLRHT